MLASSIYRNPGADGGGGSLEGPIPSDQTQTFRALSSFRLGFELIITSVVAAGLDPLEVSQGAFNLTEAQTKYLQADGPFIAHATALSQTFDRFEAYLRRDGLGISEQDFRESLGSIINRSSFAWWASNHKGGHPGDVGIVKMILGDFPPKPPMGYTFSGFLIDQFLLKAPVAEAHRNRVFNVLGPLMGGLLERSAPDRFDALSLGIGPATELSVVIHPNYRDHLSRFGWHGRDFSKDSLDAASQTFNVARGNLLMTKPDCEVRNANALRWAIFGKKYFDSLDSVLLTKIGEVQRSFVYCAGLADYVPAAEMNHLARVLYAVTKPGELMCITNVDIAHPHREIQRVFLNWPLIYRDRDQVKAFVEGLGLRFVELKISAEEFAKDPGVLEEGCFTVCADQTGVNLFLFARKPK